eukprot:TRINITY_DN2694_c2_g1_i2.p1 TRINITY_DN2694_c2_g1~~TRINITY_DN2694_c2_g1_i2.p1  ORF type:complete len:468 (+),score=70.83 TRINITY_DN2694_c2_g1_i2:30-1406(+)
MTTTTTVGMEDLPLEMIAAIADHIHDLHHLAAMMLVSRRLYNGVSLSKRWALVLEVLAGEKDGEERRKILMSREQNLIYASRQCGHARHLRHAQLDQEEAFLCLPMACGAGQIECVRYLVSTFGFKDTPKLGYVAKRTPPTSTRMSQIFSTTRLLLGSAKKGWPAHILYTDSSSFLACFTFACSSINGLPVVKYLHEECNVSADDLLEPRLFSIYMACCDGRLDVLCYLHQTGPLDPLNREKLRTIEGFPLLAACNNGHSAVVSWLCDTFKLKSSRRMLTTAAGSGHLPLVQYFVMKAGLTSADTVQFGDPTLLVACQGGHIDVVKYLHGVFTPTRRNVCHYLCWACNFGHLSIVKYLHIAFSLTAEDACTVIETFEGGFLGEACAEGELEVLKYLHTEVGVTTQDVCDLPEYIWQAMCHSENDDLISYLMDTMGVDLDLPYPSDDDDDDDDGLFLLF